jgi:endonuclease YncB( thermonuclease family)
VKVWLALIVLWTAAAPVAAQTVTDGDTLKLNGTTYRLLGIDAPKSKQWCGKWPAGPIATAMLEMLIKGKTVVCEPKTTDRYGRTVAICRADGEDLGRALVQLGMAWAFVRYSRDYVDQEAKAKAEDLWHTFREVRAGMGLARSPAAVIRRARHRERQGAGDAGVVWCGLGTTGGTMKQPSTRKLTRTLLH